MKEYKKPSVCNTGQERGLLISAAATSALGRAALKGAAVAVGASIFSGDNKYGSFGGNRLRAVVQ